METRRTFAHSLSGRNFLTVLFAALLLSVHVAAGEPNSADSTPDSFVPADPTAPRLLRERLLESLGVSKWHQAGCRGHGLKIAILDSGFHGYRQHLGKSLPPDVTVRSFRLDGNLEARDSQHGILCGEVIHTLAPEAELLFANWEPDRPDCFLAAVGWVRSQGAKIISCSVIMPTWSDGEGHGLVHRTLTRLLGTGDRPDDLLCFASAGNTAQRHWSGTFQDDGHGVHEWHPGETANIVKPWLGERVSVEVCWHSTACYETVIEDATRQREVARSRSRLAEDHCCAVACFEPEAGHDYRLRLRLVSGIPGPFHLVVLGGGLGYASRNGSIPFPADGPEVVAVGAVDRGDQRSAYSSCGPNSEAPKPDFVAEVPFPSSWRPRPFTGTSAAAPQAAALAALLWCSHPDWTPGQVRETLRKTARHLGRGEHNCDTGYGCIHLP